MTRRRAGAGAQLWLFLAYLAAGKLGLALARIHPSASAVWPPTGIALAAFLLLGRGVWPAIFGGAFVVNALTAGSLSTSLAIAAGNTLEGLAGCWLIERYAGGREALERPASVFGFALLGGLIGPLVSPTIGVTALAAGGFAPWPDFGRIWATWWLGDASGALLFAPAVLCWPAGKARSGRGVWESGLLLAAAVGASVIFWLDLLPDFPGLYLYGCLVVILWTAFRYDSRRTTLMALGLSAPAIVGTLYGHGPFLRHVHSQGLLRLQVFMGFLSVVGVAVSATVTQEKRVRELAVARSEDRFRLLVEAVRDHAMFMLDPQGTIVSWNAGAERITGRAESEAVGRHFSCFYSPEDVDAGEPARLLAAAAERGHVETETWHVRRDGSRFRAQVVVTPMRGESGELVGFAKISRDLTERDRAREAEVLREQTAIQQHFLATVSHELRTPLAAIVGFAETLRTGGLDDAENRGEFVEIIEKHAIHLSRLVEDLLEVSARGRGQRPLKSERLDLRVFVERFVAGVAPLAERKRVAVSRAVRGELQVSGDPLQLQQVLHNLFSNALEHTPAGGRVELEASAAGDNAVVTVRDTGRGIAEKDLPRVFEPFYSGERRRGERHGTGLGLAIAKDIVVAHGGDLWVESEEGRGSAFHLSLPLADRAPRAVGKR